MRKLLIISMANLAALAAQGATYGERVVAAVICAEARGEGYQGMKGVAEVIRNRASKLHLTPLRVVTQKNQFECLNRTTAKALVERQERFRQFTVALVLARMIHESPKSVGDDTHGATHFENSRRKPAWVKTMVRTTVVGRHSFYKKS